MKVMRFGMGTEGMGSCSYGCQQKTMVSVLEGRLVGLRTEGRDSPGYWVGLVLLLIDQPGLKMA